MKKSQKVIVKVDGDFYECTVLKPQKSKKKVGFLGAVYMLTYTAEKVATSLARLNKLRKKYEKARIKKLKKYGMYDKKTGVLTYGKLKRLKPAPRVKRYTVDRLSKMKET